MNKLNDILEHRKRVVELANLILANPAEIPATPALRELHELGPDIFALTQAMLNVREQGVEEREESGLTAPVRTTS